MSAEEKRTVAEQLDAAETGEEFAVVIGRLFAALEGAADNEEQDQ